MSLFNTHLDHEIESSDTVNNVATKIQPILRKEFERFYLLGMGEVSRDVHNSLKTLQANANNEKLSDKEFRQLATSITNIMLDKL